MRWPHESAITRRDDHLARTRRLSLWAAGGATAATVALTVALSSALPGHTVVRSAPATGTGAGGASSGQPGDDSSGGDQVAPPTQAPSQPTAPPVVSSGGS